MSSADEKKSPDERMELLERRAKVVRSRLLRAVDALDARRHQVVEIGDTAKKLAVPAAAAVIGVAAVLGIGVFALGMAFRSRRRSTFVERAVDAIRDLDLSPRPSLGKRVFDRAALTIVTIATTELARRAVKNVIDGRLLDGRLAVGQALDVHHEDLANGDRMSGMIPVPGTVTGATRP